MAINLEQDKTNLPAIDQDGHLCHHDDWTEHVAHQLAAPLILSAQHVAILYAVRDFYTTFEYAPPTRPLIKYLSKQLGTSITNASLMADFQTGTVARTLARLAGLPKPANCL